MIDGGSTDGTVEMLARNLCDERFRWLSEPDDGMYSAVNKGLRMASGSIVAYLNADDVFLPWSVAAAVDFLESRPDVDLVYGDAVNIDDRTGAEHLRNPATVSRHSDAGGVVDPTTCHLLASGCAQQDRIIR